jgi:outer membrane receptor for ferrienterochelin and colicins
MNKIKVYFILILMITPWVIFAQKIKTDANIVGHVVSEGQHIAFASVSVKGTTIGTVTDETGHYQLINLPERELTIVVKLVGYKSQERVVFAEAGKTIEIKFELEEDVLDIDEIVVSADRSEHKRTQAPVIINTISPQLFNSSQSVTLSEGLNFSPGLRVENNCQNCGFTQVRMNGMEGSYSQILINSRPIFSGLAGVYGLELIPSNMIEKVEVVRGGGSSLFGSNAIAGTINIILKDPVSKIYEIGFNNTFIGIGLDDSGGLASDYSLNFNSSLVSDDHKSGVSIYGFTRERKPFDANNDGFSEMAPLNNLTLGTRFFHRFGYRSKLSFDFFTIKEQRDGGNKQEYPLHERDVAEVVKHDLKTAAITYEQFFREYDLLSAFVSAQFLNRDSYYGANYSLADYGNSKDKTYNVGAQYKAVFKNSSLIVGIENTGNFLKDKKLGYPDYDNALIVNDSIIEVPHIGNTLVSDQLSENYGAFAQFELKLIKSTIAIGGRFDHYRIVDLAKTGGEIKRGNVISPRISFMYELFKNLQGRISYSQGYRAPQIFDEDLHIETSGSRQVININAQDLKQETSHSVMVSADFNGLVGQIYTGLLIEGFLTRLENPFVNDIGLPDENGTVIYTRINAADGATVKGVNFEMRFKTMKSLSFTSGFTMQISKYDNVQEFNEKRFFRTPDNYGFVVIDWDMLKNFCLSVTGNYTGKMLVPYFGTETDPESGELRQSDRFFDLGAKLKYNIKLNGASIQFFSGIKNILNSYQSDFDKGADRDPSYIYGPMNPRTIYFGFKFGNFLD